MNEHKRRERRKKQGKIQVFCNQIQTLLSYSVQATNLQDNETFCYELKIRPSPSFIVNLFDLAMVKTKKTLLNNGPSRPFLDLCFPFSRYIVRLQLINLNMVNDERKQEKRRKSIHSSIACQKKSPDAQQEQIDINSELNRHL